MHMFGDPIRSDWTAVHVAFFFGLLSFSADATAQGDAVKPGPQPSVTVATVTIDEEPVVAHIRGPEAPAILAAALGALATQNPTIIFGKIDPASSSASPFCGRETADLSNGPCGFWDAMIATKVWPQEIPLLDSVKQTFSTPTGYRLPHVSILVEYSAITSTLPGYGSLSASDKETLCRRQRWADSEEFNCFLAEVPSVGFKMRGLKVRLEKTRRAIIRQRVITLAVPVKTSADADAVKQTLQKSFSTIAADVGSRANLAERVNARPLLQDQPTPLTAAAAIAPACDDQSLSLATTLPRALISWPDTILPVAARKGSFAVVEFDEKVIPATRSFVFDSDVAGPDWANEATMVAQHPIFAGLPWRLSCSTVAAAPSEGPLAHTIAVASVLVGQQTRLDLSAPDKFVQVTPFFSPSGLQINSVRAMLPSSNLVTGNPNAQVILASLQIPPPKPVTANPPKFGFRVKDYVQYTYLLMATGKIVIAAAPLVTSIVPEEEADPTDNFKCPSWPGCLDSLGFTLTVAALDKRGELMTSEPGKNVPYQISPRTVAIAAPGEAMLVATLRDASPSLAFASGTSVAAPVVGALALKLRERLPDISQTYDIIATIEASADLSRNFGRLRFGVINAARALTMAGLPQKGAYLFPLTLDESKDGRSTGVQRTEVQGIRPPSTCSVASFEVGRGVLLYYRPTDPQIVPTGLAEPPRCIPVSHIMRIRQVSLNGGRRLYDIVYHDEKSYIDFFFPQIVRNVHLEPSTPPLAACMVAMGTVGATDRTQPCLTGIAGPDGRVRINLNDVDLAFQPSGYLEGK